MDFHPRREVTDLVWTARNPKPKLSNADAEPLKVTIVPNRYQEPYTPMYVARLNPSPKIRYVETP